MGAKEERKEWISCEREEEEEGEEGRKVAEENAVDKKKKGPKEGGK